MARDAAIQHPEGFALMGGSLFRDTNQHNQGLGGLDTLLCRVRVYQAISDFLPQLLRAHNDEAPWLQVLPGRCRSSRLHYLNDVGVRDFLVLLVLPDATPFLYRSLHVHGAYSPSGSFMVVSVSRLTRAQHWVRSRRGTGLCLDALRLYPAVRICHM